MIPRARARRSVRTKSSISSWAPSARSSGRSRTSRPGRGSLPSKGYVDLVALNIEPPAFLDEMVKRVFGVDVRYVGPFPMGEYQGPGTLEDGEMTFPKLDADQVLSALLTVFREDTSRVIMLT